MNQILNIKNLCISYEKNEVINNLSFEIFKGDFIGLAGPNGGGKTTLIKAILGLIPIDKGEIKILDNNIKNFKDWRKIGYLPQKSSKINILFPATVNEIISLGLLSQKTIPKKIGKIEKEKVNNILNELNILNLKNRMFNELSGGEQQKVLLGRALISNPEILIFDEPTTALDPNSRESFFELIQKLNKEKGISIILITHDTGYIGTYANKLMYLDHELKYYGEISGFCGENKDDNCFRKIGEHIIWHQHK